MSTTTLASNGHTTANPTPRVGDLRAAAHQGGEPVIFEKSTPGAVAVSLPALDVPAVRPGDVLPAQVLAKSPPALPELGELDVVRHYTRLAHRLFSVDANFYPLGSCTMKYNPKVNERAAAMPGFADVHPLTPDADCQGLLELLWHTRRFLEEISGLHEVCLQPCAGAHGELTALMVINAYHRSRHQPRRKVLAPDSAHGTNPASCAMCSRDVVTIKSRKDGLVDMDDFRRHLDDDVAALMLTNPNTVGLFDPQLPEIADLLHARGALLYMDGANMNASLGIARPGDLGVDVMHYNTHKTFSTPHGCGGPGSGPIAVRSDSRVDLAPFLPVPRVLRRGDGSFCLQHEAAHSIGRVRSFFGQVGVLVRCYAYIRGVGGPGLKKVSEQAVLSANYLAAKLRDVYQLPFAAPYAHEFVISAVTQKAQGATAMDIAKRLLDFGFHPPTMYWPAIVAECIMIEPTETESKATLDAFIAVLRQIAEEAREQPALLRHAPHETLVRRVDAVASDRKPKLRWKAE